jgi:hypothetical protein
LHSWSLFGGLAATNFVWLALNRRLSAPEHSLQSPVGLHRTERRIPFAAADAVAERLPVWRANMEELTRRLKHEACTQLVNDKHGPRAAAAVAAMLQSSSAQGGQVSRLALISSTTKLPCLCAAPSRVDFCGPGYCSAGRKRAI